jgi:hypothetical protein
MDTEAARHAPALIEAALKRIFFVMRFFFFFFFFFVECPAPVRRQHHRRCTLR